jgi:hypothetical protein
MNYDKPKTPASVFALGRLDEDIIPACPRGAATGVTLLIGMVVLFTMFVYGVWDVHVDVEEHNFRAGFSVHERAVWESEAARCFATDFGRHCASDADVKVRHLRRARALLSRY